MLYTYPLKKCMAQIEYENIWELKASGLRMLEWGRNVMNILMFSDVVASPVQVALPLCGPWYLKALDVMSKHKPEEILHCTSKLRDERGPRPESPVSSVFKNGHSFRVDLSGPQRDSVTMQGKGLTQWFSICES